MDPAVWTEIDRLQKLNTAALKAKYQELFGAKTHSSNKQFLFRRIAWRLQARAEGDLRERARERAAGIADDTEIRLRVPKEFLAGLPAAEPTRHPPRRPPRDWRLPPAGTVLARQHRGQQIVVHVTPSGFEFQGRHYRSLSAIAREVTGTRWNGLAFFHLTERHHG